MDKEQASTQRPSAFHSLLPLCVSQVRHDIKTIFPEPAGKLGDEVWEQLCPFHLLHCAVLFSETVQNGFGEYGYLTSFGLQ